MILQNIFFCFRTASLGGSGLIVLNFLSKTEPPKTDMFSKDLGFCPLPSKVAGEILRGEMVGGKGRRRPFRAGI